MAAQQAVHAVVFLASSDGAHTVHDRITNYVQHRVDSLAYNPLSMA